MATKPKVPELGTDTAPPPAPVSNSVPDLGTAPLTPPPPAPIAAGVQSDTDLTQPQSAPQPKVGEPTDTPQPPADGEPADEPPPEGETDETEGEQPLPPDQPSPVLTEAARGTPSLALANAPGIGNAIGGNPVNPLDHDGDGKSGGAIPAGATRDYSSLLAAEATANAKATELQGEVTKLRAENTGLRKQLSQRNAGGDEALADNIVQKLFDRFSASGGGSRRTASGADNTPPKNIEDLRTPGINS